jgi:hypothetical protein
LAHRKLVIAISLAAALASLEAAATHPALGESRAWQRVGAPAESLGAIPVAAVLYYKDKCLTCHGATGKGDGEGAKALDPKPRSFADKAWQTSVSDDQIRDITVRGGPAVGKSAGMPAHPDLKGKPEVLNGLVALIRAFGK